MSQWLKLVVGGAADKGGKVEDHSDCQMVLCWFADINCRINSPNSKEARGCRWFLASGLFALLLSIKRVDGGIGADVLARGIMVTGSDRCICE
jgi:hypothetical protein